jgi:hypothetical protein
VRSLNTDNWSRPNRVFGLGGVVIILFFALFWTALVGAFDWMAGNTIVRQLASEKFPSAVGQITHSEVTVHHGKGASYGVDLRYSYKVAGRTFTAQRYRYGEMASSDSAWARRAVAAHPVGSPATVFYNPRNPWDALLAPGLNGGDLMLPLFLTPFNIVMLGLWYGVGLTWRRLYPPPLAGGVKIIRDGFRTRARLPTFSALVAGLGTVALASFLGTFAVAIGGGFHPSLPWVAGVIATAYGAGIAAYAWQWRKINSGDDDLIIDEGARQLELPRTFQRKERITVGFSEITSLRVITCAHATSKGGTSYTYAPTLYPRGNEAQGEKLADWSDKAKAEAFTDWLRERLGLTSNGTEA